MKDNYKGINIPNELADEIDKIIHSKKHGYRTRAEFIKEAIRTHLKDYKQKK